MNGNDGSVVKTQSKKTRRLPHRLSSKVNFLFPSSFVVFIYKAEIVTHVCCIRVTQVTIL